MYCKFCGEKIADDSVSCPICKQLLSAPMPSKPATEQEEGQNTTKSVMTNTTQTKAIHSNEKKVNTSTNGMVAWILGSLNMLLLFLIVLSVFGIKTASGEGDVIFVNSQAILSVVGVLLGSVNTGIPVWITGFVTFVIAGLALTFAIIQISKHKDSFSITTIIVITIVVITTIAMSMGGWEAIVGVLY